MNDLLNVNLPKWPQLMIVGEDVSVEQAKDIIFRTDSFLTDSSRFSGGNAQEFNRTYREEAGLDFSWLSEDQEQDLPLQFDFEVAQRVRQRIGFVHLNYIESDWASCPFVGGPHGFCSPEGKIYFQDNVGKWPDVEDIYHDFCLIAEHFPFINLKATLYNGESCEEDSIPLVSFVVQNGNVDVVNEDFKLKERYFVHHLDNNDIVQLLTQSAATRELGLPWEWYDDFARVIFPLVNEETDKYIKECKQ